MIELTVRLTDEQLAQIVEGAAELVAERLQIASVAERLLTVDELAEMLAVTPIGCDATRPILVRSASVAVAVETRSDSERPTWSAFSMSGV